MSFIKIKGKPLEKLIEVVSKGIGVLYKPTEIRKIADAEAYKIEKIETAKARSKVITDNIEIESRIKIEERLAFQETKRQLNIENITYKAAEQLQHDTEVSDEQLDEDWITRFFNTVQDVSNEEMQILWSRILAGEIKRPKSFSLRTLEFLKNISQEDAALLTEISKYNLQISGSDTLIYKPFHIAFRDKWNLPYKNVLYLIEIGILNPNDSDFILHNEIKAEIWVTYGKKALVFEREKIGVASLIAGTTFTTIGSELLKLIKSETNEEYFNMVLKHVSTNRNDFKINIGQQVGIENDEILYDNFEEWEKL